MKEAWPTRSSANKRPDPAVEDSNWWTGVGVMISRARFLYTVPIFTVGRNN